MILLATDSGCRLFTGTGEGGVELAGRKVEALTPELDGACLAILDGQEIWRRDSRGTWSIVLKTDISLQSITFVNGTIFAGAMEEAAILRIPSTGKAERLQSFDLVPGRNMWFAGGPP